MRSTRAGAATQVAPAHGLVGRRPADAPRPRHRQRLADGGLVAAGGVRVPWACGARWSSRQLREHKGFNITSLKRMRQFYRAFPNGSAIPTELGGPEKGAAVRHLS